MVTRPVCWSGREIRGPPTPSLATSPRDLGRGRHPSASAPWVRPDRRIHRAPGPRRTAWLYTAWCRKPQRTCRCTHAPVFLDGTTLQFPFPMAPASAGRSGSSAASDCGARGNGGVSSRDESATARPALSLLSVRPFPRAAVPDALPLLPSPDFRSGPRVLERGAASRRARPRSRARSLKSQVRRTGWSPSARSSRCGRASNGRTP